MMNELVNKARLFAEFHHGIIGQKRKYTGEPYIRHPAGVVAILKEHNITDPTTIAAAWLHDTVEDTDARQSDIRRLFGDRVGEYVYYLTDEKLTGGNRATRKALDRDRLERAPLAVRRIKAADCIHNTLDIVKHDPKFAKTYISEISMLASMAFRETDEAIFISINKALERARQEL